MYIFKINSEEKNKYYRVSNLDKIYWWRNRDTFLKLYEEYIGEKYPVFSRINSDSAFSTYIITEKDERELKEKIEKNVQTLLSYTNDKRIKRMYADIEFIIRIINGGFLVLNEVPFADISKEFMTGEKQKVSTYRNTTYDILRCKDRMWTTSSLGSFTFNINTWEGTDV